MIPATDNHRRPDRPKAHQCFIEQPHDVDTGQGSVIDIPGDEDNVHRRVPNSFYQLVDE
ncbi:hypothetical protein GCM10009611_12340 [Arthrobacter roseus]